MRKVKLRVHPRPLRPGLNPGRLGPQSAPLTGVGAGLEVQEVDGETSEFELSRAVLCPAGERIRSFVLFR